jgi:hypothetical protein
MYNIMFKTIGRCPEFGLVTKLMTIHGIYLLEKEVTKNEQTTKRGQTYFMVK